MEERELVIRANDYIKKLSNGINPLTGEMLKQDDIVNNVKVTRCLYFVSYILEKYLSCKDLSSKSKRKKSNFFATKNDLLDYPFSEKNVNLSHIISNINNLIVKDDMKNLKITEVSDWLVYKELLKMDIDSEGKCKKIPTEKGRNIGINTELRETSKGEYSVNIYNLDAQKFIIENIDEIVKYINN